MAKRPAAPTPVSPFSARLPKPPLRWLLLAMAALWVGFAIAVNWIGVGGSLYEALILDVDAFWRGQVWRLFTAPFMHEIGGQSGVFHIVFNLLIIGVFGRTLQDEWGGKRLLFVLGVAALAGEIAGLVAPHLVPGHAAAVLSQGAFLGSYAMGYACIGAFGFSHRDAPVSFFFFPTRGINLVWISLAFYVLVLIAAGRIPEGVLAPFAGVGVGYVLGGSTPSPLRKLFLRRKLAALEKRTARSGPKLHVIEGGGDEPRPIDKKYLN